MYKLVLSELFACRLDSEAYGFLSQFPNMVQWWLVRGKEADRQFSEFRNQFYNQWKLDWTGYIGQHAQTSCLVAHNTLNLPKTPTKEELKCSFAVVSQRIAKIDEHTLSFPTKQSKKANVTLLPKDTSQCILLEQAQNKYWQIGQIFLTPTWCAIPFTRCLDLTKEKDPYIQDIIK